MVSQSISRILLTTWVVSHKFVKYPLTLELLPYSHCPYGARTHNQLLLEAIFFDMHMPLLWGERIKLL